MSVPPESGTGLDFHAAVERIPFLRSLPPEDLGQLRSRAQCRRLARGEALWWEGEPSGDFIFLAGGRVKLVKSSAGGREVIVDLCGPGQLLCSSAVCGATPCCCTAVSLEDAGHAVVISRRDLLDLLEMSPAASRAFLHQVTGRDMDLSRRIQELAAGQVDRRIAGLLLRLTEQLGMPHKDGGTWVPLVLSRQDLADLTGTTIETTIRVMSRFSRQNVVHTAAKGFHVTDSGALQDVARGEGA